MGGRGFPRIHAAHEEARRPVELAAFNKETREIEAGLFRKTLYRRKAELFARHFTGLDITVVCFGPLSPDTQAEKIGRLFHEAEALHHLLLKFILTKNNLVGRRNNQVGLRMKPVYVSCRQGRGGRRAQLNGLGHHILCRQVGQLLANHIDVFGRCAHVDILRRQQFGKAPVRNLEHAQPHAEEVEKLFGPLLAAIGPQAATHAAGQDNAIIV